MCASVCCWVIPSSLIHISTRESTGKLHRARRYILGTQTCPGSSNPSWMRASGSINYFDLGLINTGSYESVALHLIPNFNYFTWLMLIKIYKYTQTLQSTMLLHPSLLMRVTSSTSLPSTLMLTQYQEMATSRGLSTASHWWDSLELLS